MEADADISDKMDYTQHEVELWEIHALQLLNFTKYILPWFLTVETQCVVMYISLYT